MQSALVEIYPNMINDFILKSTKGRKNVIIFFQGFPGSFYKALENIGIKRFSNTPIVQDTGYIDYSKINAGDVLQNYLGSQGICWGYYEELVALTEILNDLTVYKGDLMVVQNSLFSVYYPIEVPINLQTASHYFENESSQNGDEELGKYYSDLRMVNNIGFFSYVNKHYDIDTNKSIKEIDFFERLSENTSPTEALEIVHITSQDLDIIKAKLQNGMLSSELYRIQSLNKKPDKDVHAFNVLGALFSVRLELEDVVIRVEIEENLKHFDDFKKYWGSNSHYRMLPIYKEPAISSDTIDVSQGVLISDIITQCENAINGISNYSDIIITAPTGAGKSLFFQVPAIHMHENYDALTLVITPLIALMQDQVHELEMRGITFSTFINSEITFEQRIDRLDGIKNGRYSIVYLSPELLLANDIRNIIGDRQLALIVIDEAHLVTSWGRDFRVDYWFLGDYLEKIRRTHYYQRDDALKFPILCLTATAVFGGRDDVVGDLQNSLRLNCSAEHLYIGYVRRDNIEFNIVQASQKRNTKKDDKIKLTCKRIKEFCDQKEKAIVYFPYVSQIDDVYNEIISNHYRYKPFVEKYSGTMDKFDKNEAYTNFRDEDVSIMLATKAFGMGVNVPNIRSIYHFAPTGTLADYVQEIGRAARKLDQGCAIMDYMPNDMHYAMTLWGLSGLKHYQIKAMMKKLYDLYLTKKSRNLLFSPDVFGYLFDANSVDNKVKSGLMLLSTDLLEKYHFRVITVRPKNVFSKHYIHVPSEVEREFLGEFGKYSTLMNDDKPKVIPAHGRQSEVKVYNENKIYEIDLSKVWENEFNDLTFAKFKYHFFKGDLFSFGADKITPRIKLIIHYEKNYEMIKEEMLKIISAVQLTISNIYREYHGKEFTFEAFRTEFNNHYKKKVRREYVAILLDMFCYEGVYFEEIPVEQWKFINKTRTPGEGQYNESKYSIRTHRFNFIEQNLKRFLVQCQPNSEDKKMFVTYLKIPKGKDKYSEYQLLASMLELFNLTTYELIGGRNPQIFVRINDPLKLKRIADSDREYRNGLLTDIGEKHKRSARIVDKFMTINMEDEERWSLIESYFLGYDGDVDTILGIDD